MIAPPAAARRRRRAAVSVLLAGVLVVAVVLVVRSVADAGQAVGGDMGDLGSDRSGGSALLTYELVTRHPTKQGNLRLVVDADGAVRAQRNDVEPPPGQEWAAELPDEPSTTLRNAPDRLVAILRAGNFFEMDRHQVNEAGTDGTLRVLTWNGDGGPRTVTVDRARPADFDRIVGEIARLTSVPGM